MVNALDPVERGMFCLVYNSECQLWKKLAQRKDLYTIGGAKVMESRRPVICEEEHSHIKYIESRMYS